MKRGGNMKSRKKLARLLAVLVASSMVLGSPNAVAFAEGNEISEESLSGEKTAAAPAEAKESAEQKEPVSEEISDEGTNTPVKKAEAEQTGAAVSNTEKAEAEPKKSGESGPEKEEKPETVQAFLAALDKIMELQENDAEAEEVLAAVKEAKKLYGALSEEEKALEEVKAGYEALESFESVNPLEEVELNGKGTAEDPWLVGSEDELRKVIDSVEYDETYIKLTGDISAAKGIDVEEGKIIIIDLAGHTLRSEDWYTIAVSDFSELTVKDGTIENKGSCVIWVVSYGMVTVEGSGTIKNTNPYGGKGISAESAFEVNVFGTIESAGIGICTEGSDGSTVEINSGAEISSSNDSAIKLNSGQDDAVCISGGTISGRNGIEIGNGTLEIKGQTTRITGTGEESDLEDGYGAGVMLKHGSVGNVDINITVKEAAISGACAVYGKYVTQSTNDRINVTLENGRYTSTAKRTTVDGEELKVAVYLEDSGQNVQLSMEGGKYSGDAGKLKAYETYYEKYFGNNDNFGLTEISEGKETYYEVVDATADTAEVNGRKYTSLKAAVSAAESGATVTLRKDVTEEDITVGKKITLDLNGYTVESYGSEPAISVEDGGNLTVDGSKDGSRIEAFGSYGRIFFVDGGELRLSGGTYSSKGEDAVIDSRGGTITVDKGTVVEGAEGIFGGTGMGANADRKSTVTVHGKVSGTGEAAVTISGGALTVEKTGHITAVGNCIGIKIPDDGSTVNVYGSVEAKNDGVGFYYSGDNSTLNVYPGAKISSENSRAIYLDSKNLGNIETIEENKDKNKEGMNKVNITGGTITGKNGIVVQNGTLHISGDSTEITGSGNNIDEVEYGGNPSPSGAGVLIYKGVTYYIGVTVEGDAEIKGQCAIYGVTDKSSEDDPVKYDLIEVALKGGKLISAAETNIEQGKTLKAAFNLSGIKGAALNVSLSGGSYFGEDDEAYAEYYKGYCADNCDIEKVKESGKIYYKVVDKTAKVAKVGEEEYSTLQEAIDAAKAGETVTLLADVTECVTVDKEIVLDLADFTLTNVDGEGKHTITVADGGNLTVNGPGTVDNVSHHGAAVQNEAGGFVRLNSGTYNRSKENGKTTEDAGGNSWYTIVNCGEMVIGDGNDDVNDLHILQNGSFTSMVRNGLGTKDADENTLTAKMTINGGYFDHGKIDIKNEAYGEVTVNGGKFMCNQWGLVNYGKAVIAGGDFSTTVGGLVYNGVDNLAGADKAKKGELKISGGEFKYNKGYYCISDYAPEKTWITGGIYCTKYAYRDFANGKNLTSAVMPYTYDCVTTDGGYTVKPVEEKDAVAKIGDRFYYSLQNAMSDAKDGDTVILLKDTREDITVSKEIGLDLNGKTITGNTKTYAIQVNSGNLTIKDGSEEKSGKLIATKGALTVGKDGIFVLDSGTLHADNFYGCYVSDGGKIVVNGGEIISAYAAIAGNNTTGDMNFEIHGGTLTAKDGPAIYMPGQGSLRMDGGTLNGGIALRMGQVEISGGTINAASGVYKIGDIIAEGSLAGKPNYTVSGCVFLSDAIYALAGAYASSNEEYSNSLNLKITGGTINAANGAGTAVAIYDLGKVTQDIRIEVAEGTVLSTNTADRHLVEVLTLKEAGITNPESGYGETENKTTEKIAEKFEHIYPSAAASVTKNATCTENGEGIFVCSVCGESKTGSIPALGHNWVNDRCERCGTERNTGSDSGSSGGGSSSSSGRRSSSRDEILNAGGASPMLIPVPQQTAVQEPAAAPTPAATQPAAAAPEPLPAEEPAQLEDESVPLAEARQEETKGREEPEKVINIGDEEVPMAAPSTSWAFLNLILMLVTAAGAIATVIGSVRRKGEEAEETGSTVWMIGLIPAICSTAMFVLTEKIGGSIVIADRWTVAMLLIALVEGAVVFFVYRMMNKAHNRA